MSKKWDLIVRGVDGDEWEVSNVRGETLRAAAVGYLLEVRGHHPGAVVIAARRHRSTRGEVILAGAVIEV